MAWHDRESLATVRQIVATTRRNALAAAAALPAGGAPLPPGGRVWVQPPLPLELEQPRPVSPPAPPRLPTVRVTKILVTPTTQGNWRVVVKAVHEKKGPVYRFGEELSLDAALGLVEWFLGGDYWTPDKYPA